MSKKTHTTATQELEAAQQVYWRLLLRNPTFQNEMALLKKMYPTSRKNSPSSANRKYSFQDIGNLWSALSNRLALRRINYKPIELWPETKQLSLDDILALESEPSLFITPYEPILISYDPNDKYFSRIPPNIAPNTRFLFVRVDLSHPIESILPLVEKQVRPKAKQFTKLNQSQLKKIDFQLKVYDCALQGETFSKIAREFRKRVATIKSAYLLAKGKIDALSLEILTISPSEKQPNKKARTLASFDANFDPETHYTSCPTCKNAKTADEMCPLVQSFANQDKRSLPPGASRRYQLL